MREFNDHKIWWDEALGIARASAIGTIDEPAARFILLETARIAQQNSENVDWIIDLHLMTKVTPKARKILAEASGYPSIRKYAFVGASTFIRTIANSIAAAAGQKNARHYATEQEALIWLQEE